ncbi:MAG: hypothetical protein Ct9H300mP19_13810 [Dehalococcoidia bacterium]|nr:MAG: hypothetical protein Ct9H300mP19_13810 [Dehalococcoidia bacterium]
MARALAEFMFDDEDNMIRVDMSEFQERHTVSKLIGAPPGYVGYDDAGHLTEAVRVVHFLWCYLMRLKKLTRTFSIHVASS